MRISDWSSDVGSSDLQVVGAQPRLHVLERDVVHGLARREGVPELAQHLLGRGADVDGLDGCTERLGGCDGVLEVGRGPCRERVCQYASIVVVAVPLKNKAALHRQWYADIYK